MKKESENSDILQEYDFPKGVRGKYVRMYHRGSDIIVLESDLAERFPNSQAVNQALRSLANLQNRKRPDHRRQE